MARTPEDDFGGQSGASAAHQKIQLSVDGKEIISLPSADFVKNSDILREGQDLVLEGPDGTVIVIEGYFNADPAPLLQAPDGQALSPQLVNSFVHHAGPAQYARAGTLSDESPVGAINEISGQATVTRTDGTKENITVGTPIFEGDVVETEGSGAVNIIFIDETSLSVSENAKLAIDEYVFDPSSQSGTTDVSVLRGLFVFTSGLIGRDDPDDVNIDTPMGSIGIRGTVIVGNADTGEVTVMEGAIVLRGFNGNEVTLAQQFETGKFTPASGDVTYLGKSDPGQFANNYSTLKPVAPNLFSGMADNGQTGDNANDPATGGQQGSGATASGDTGNQDGSTDPAGTTDTSGQQDATTTQTQPAATNDSGTTDSNSTDPAGTDTSTSTDTSFDGGSDSGFDDSATTTTTSPTGTTSDSGTTSTTSGGTTSGSGTTGTTSGGTTDSTATQPPPSVTGGTGGTAPVTTVSAVSDSDNAANAIAENLAAGSVVGVTAFASDPTAGDTVSYSLTNNPGGLFQINATTGVVTTTAALDAETQTSYSITVQATSSDGSTQSRAFTIGVTDDNSEYTMSAISDADGAADTISETVSNGASVGITAQATDNDVTDSTTYSLDDDAGGRFAIDANTGVVTVADAGQIDFETNTSHNITVRATSSDGSFTTQGYTVAIADDTAEASISAISDTDGNANSFSESATNGTAIGITAFASDADGSDTVTYSLDDNAGGRFAINASTGVITIANDTLIDYESATSHNITVRATSSDGSFTTQGYTVGVADDTSEFSVTAITDSDGAANTISESDGNGTAVGITAAASDSDGSDNVTFSLDDDASGRFAINATTGVVTIADAGQIDYEAATSHNITVRATSSDGSFTTQGYTVNITDDVTEAAVSAVTDSDGAADSIAENVANGAAVGITAAATDADASDTVTYSLTDDAGGRFTINSSTGVVTVANDTLIDFETNTSHNITVRATSTDGTFSDQNFTINVTDIDDNDNIIGDALNNTLNGGIGDDIINANDGDDTITVNDNDGNDTIDGGNGNDTYDASGTANDRTYNLGDGSTDTVVDGGETDNVQNVEIFKGGTGADNFVINDSTFAYDLFGGTGGSTDSLYYSALNNTHTVDFDFAAGDATINGGTVHNFSEFEAIIGSQGDDKFIATDSDGAMTLDGSGGNDTYDGSTLGSAVNISYSAGSWTATGTDTDTLTSFEIFKGSNSGDTINLSGSTAAETAYGGGGGDTMTAGAGDILHGGLGADSLSYNGGNADGFEMHGGDGADSFTINSGTFDMAADGTAKKIIGGDSAAHIDTLSFSSSGTITLNPDGAEDIITGVETYDFQNSMTNTVNIDLKNFMINNNDGNLLTIKIDNSDTLNLDFTALSGTWGADSSGASWVEYTDGTRTVRIEDVSGGGISGMSVTGAAPGLVGLDLNALGGTDGFKITDDNNEGFGHSVAAIGDVDGDGFDDLAFTKQTNASGNGRVFILNGQASGFTSDTLPNLTGTVISEQNGFFSGNGNTNDMTLGGYGDFNGDGVLDYVISAPSADTGGSSNMTGNAQVVDGSTGSVLLQLDGANFAFGDELGKSVSFIGDINGDGYDDILVGAPGMDGGSTNEGGAFILFGTPSGPLTQDASKFNDGETLKTNETGVGTGAKDSAILTDDGDRFMAVAGDSGVKLFDVSNPDTPSLLDSWTSGLNATSVTLAFDHDSGKSFVFIASGNGAGNDNISRLEIDGAGNMISEVSIGDAAGEFNNVVSIDVDFHTGIGVALSPNKNNGGTDGSLTIFDPASPGAARTYFSDAALFNASEVLLNGNYAYVATPTGIQTVNNLGGTPSLGNFDALNNVTDIDMEDGHLFAVTNDGVNSRLSIFDVTSNPSNPALVSNFVNAEFAGVMDVYVEHDMAIMVVDKGATASIMIVNIEDPASPVLEHTITNVAFSDVQAIVAADGFAYVLDANNANNLQTIDMHSPGIAIDGAANGDLAGTNVSSAGDFNNDGFEDFIVSMPGADSVAIVFGGEMGLDLTDNTTFMEISGITDTDENIPLYNTGDFDGDGISDIAIAGDNDIRIFFGNDTYNKASSKTFASADLQIAAAAGSEIVGAGAVNDFDADGFNDFVVAMRDTSGNGDMINVYVVYGGATGTLDNSTLGAGLNDPANAFLMTYQIPGAGADNNVSNFDLQISAAGDINGDGFEDIVITTPDMDTVIDGSSDGADGEAMIIFGRPSFTPAFVGDATNESISGQGGVSDYILGEGGDDTIQANANLQILVGGTGNDTLMNNGKTGTTFLGGAGNDQVVINDDQFFKIDGGTGFDTLNFQGAAGSVLDLSNLGSESVNGIEAINYAGGTAQTVVLGMDDIFDMMGDSPDGIAKINGDSNDIFAIELPGFDGPLGILTDNDWQTHQDGEGHLHAFNARITDPSGDTNYYGFDHNGQQLWISKALIDSGQVVLGSNIVTDDSADDTDASADNLQASDIEQTLVGNNADNIFDDGAQNDISMFGFGGNDTFTLNNGNFDVINGGTGNDTINVETNLDLRSFGNHDITHVEALTIGSSSSVLTLSLENIIGLLSSSDTSTLTITAANAAAQTLKIDNMNAADSSGTPDSTTAVQTAIGASGVTDGGSVWQFNDVNGMGGYTLEIDKALFTNNNVDVI